MVRLYRQYLSTGVTVLSALVCGGVTILWLVTFTSGGFFVALQGPFKCYVASVMGGEAAIQIGSVAPDTEMPETFHWHWLSGGTEMYPIPKRFDADIWTRFGLIRADQLIPYTNGLPNELDTYRAYCRCFILPLWFIALIAGIPFMQWMVRRRHQRIRELRIRGGRCPDCGYDLRGSPDRCPECGMARHR